jgi:Flp pilus assembly protein TadG
MIVRAILKANTMKRLIHRVISVNRDHRASVAIEMALIAPVLITLVIGVVDYGMYVMDSMRVSKGVASAVQFAMYNSDNDDGIRQVAYTASKFSSSQASIDIQHLCQCPTTGSCADNCPNDNHKKIIVSVAMQYAYTPTIPYPFVASAIISRSASIQVP